MKKSDWRYLHTWAAYKTAQKSSEFDHQLVEAIKRIGGRQVRCESCGKKLSVKIAVGFKGGVYHSVCAMKIYEKHVRETIDRGELLPA